MVPDKIVKYKGNCTFTPPIQLELPPPTIYVPTGTEYAESPKSFRNGWKKYKKFQL